MYYFYLGDLMLPVPPAKLVTKFKNRNKTITLMNDGEVNLVKQAGLTEVSFDMRIPGDSRPYANYNGSLKSSALSYLSKKILGKNYSYKPASYYLPKLEKMKTSKEPFSFIVLRTTPRYSVLFDTCMDMTLESYSIQEDAREGFDITIPITLKQYVDYGTKEVEVKTDENGNKTVSIKQSRKTGNLANLKKGQVLRGQQSIFEAAKTVFEGGAPSIGTLANIAVLSGMKNPYSNPVPGTKIKIPNGVIH